MNNPPIDAQVRQLEAIVTALLSDSNHSEAELRATIMTYRHVAGPDLTDKQCEAVVRSLIARLSIDVERGVALVSEDFEEWLDQKKRSIRWDRWLTYKQFLINSKWPPRVVEKLDELTDQILEFAGDPSVPNDWARRGLVLGEVQSGKTASYLGLFNKAADAGYRLIIVLAGHTESLRQQTQSRVDEGFIGRDTTRSPSRRGTAVSAKYIGVGKINKQIADPQGMTTSTRDFTKGSYEATSITVTTTSAAPYIFVVKKNRSVLRALADWLKEQPNTQGKLDVPLLLLDDESDYASVNTREETNPTAINDAIRSILGKFSRSSYVAFTATPFANIFVDHENTDDLFPRDFIYSLESPSNYIGATETFGTADDTNSTNLIELDDVDDYIPLKHKSDFQIDRLPPSLLDAIRAFFIANAIRDLRHQSQGRSMLINVTRFKRVQRAVFDLVESEVAGMKNAIELYSVLHSRGEENQQIAAFHNTFASIYPDCEYSWKEVLDVLAAAVSDVRVQLFNSDRDYQLSEEQVLWDRPKRLIAVGGDVLSRGLTLEGLTTSYFYRRTQASDTLLQMARWFGYRDGYHDICRVWIDPTVADDYRFVAESVDELRRDLRAMYDQKLTPREFGLAVRKHPGSLLVTARNKMKSAEERVRTISLIARRLESTKLPADPALLQQNYQSLSALITKLLAERPTKRTFRQYAMWNEVPKSEVADFLDRFHAHSSDEIFSQNVISKFVRSTGTPRFKSWDIVLVNGARTSPQQVDTVGGLEFFAPERTFTTGQNGELRLGGSAARLAGADDLRNVIDKDESARAADRFRVGRGKGVNEDIYYPLLKRPAILIYALRAAQPSADQAVDAHKGKLVASKQRAADIVRRSGVFIVALKVAFPGDRTNIDDTSGDVKYIINSVAIQTWFPDYEDLKIEDDVDA